MNAVLIGVALVGLLAQGQAPVQEPTPAPAQARAAFEAYRAGLGGDGFDKFIALLGPEIAVQTAWGADPGTAAGKSGRDKLDQRFRALTGLRFSIGSLRTAESSDGAIFEFDLTDASGTGAKALPMALSLSIREGKVVGFREYLGQAPAEADAQTAGVQRAEREWVQALTSGNGAGLVALAEDGFVTVMPDGTLRNAQALGQEVAAANRLFEDWRVDDAQVRVAGRTAVWSGTVRTRERLGGISNLGFYRVTSVWVLTPDGWKIRLRQFTPVLG